MGLLDFAGALMQQGFNWHNQNRQNQFNAAQADLNRQFQAQESQIARDWQEQQYLQHSSPQAMVRQYNEAGLNPALMYGQNLQSSTGSSPIPYGSQASGSALSAGMPTGNIAEAIGSLAKLQAEIQNIRADTFQKERSALASNASAAKAYSDISVGKQEISESKHRIYNLIARTDSEKLKQQAMALEPLLTREEIKLKRGQQLNLSYQNFKEQYQRSFYDRNGFYPEDNIVKSAWSILDGIVQNIQFYGGKLLKFGENLLP